MDAELIKIVAYIIGGGILILFFVHRASKPRKCVVCGINTENTYRDKEDKFISLCRDHSISRWKDEVLASDLSMIIIEPDFAKYSQAYLYATPNQLRMWEYPKEAQDNVSNIINSIKDKICNDCGSKASVAYFRKEDFDVPFFEELKPANIYLCKNCSVKKIEPILKNSRKDFGEGLYAPTDGPGVYHVQEF